MKKKIYGFCSFLLLSGLILWLNSKHIEDPSVQALQAVADQFSQGIAKLDEAINEYKKTGEGFLKGTVELYDLQQAHLNTRLAFKEVEFLLEYFDKQAVKFKLNGPPLPKVEQNVPDLTILHPKGLQVLDELVFGGEAYELKDSIGFQLKKLEENFNTVQQFQQARRLQHRFVFEAVRYELIRVFTLGVTGFDTPGSVNAIPEANRSMQSLAKAMSAYYPMIALKDYSLQQRLAATFTESILYLQQHNNFDTFNRLVFLKKYINPLFRDVLKAQQNLGIETIYEASDGSTSFNFLADNIFADDVLDVNHFANIIDNELTQDRIELGRILFFDPLLSANNEGACASCHDPEKGFTDGRDKSLAIHGEGKILRNAPTLINSVFAEKYFYDLREHNLERQIKHVVMDPHEFNTDFQVIEEKLAQSRKYKNLFAKAYADKGKYQLSKYSISNALACYVASLHSFNSPFDQYVRGEIKEIDPAVERGFNLFMGKAACGTCHFAPTFNGLVPPLFEESESEVLGVPTAPDTINATLDPDLGRIANAKNLDMAPFYQHSFKTTTVRNIALTAPYMHNGVYQTLEEVIDFYNRGGGAGIGIDLPYQTLPDAPLNLTKEEISDLVSFMESLTDTTKLTHKPSILPKFEENPEWNSRPVGGNY